jgi:hypothetical protein
LAAGADLLEVGAWIIDPKGGLMCFAAGNGAKEQQQQQQQRKQQQQLHSDEAIIWAEAHATMASRASLTAEMQAKLPSRTPPATHLNSIHSLFYRLILSLARLSAPPSGH